MTYRHLSAAAVTIATVLAGPITARAADEHRIVSPAEIKWAPGPASIPPGAQAAVLYGDPGKEGLFALRLKLPTGYAIGPHTHPKPEVVTVVSGTFRLGMGEKADKSKGQALLAGSFFALPARHGALRLRRRGHRHSAQQHGSVDPHLHQPGRRPEEEMNRTAPRMHRFDWLAGAATLLAVTACYGTLALIAVLSLMGIALAVDEDALGGVIVALAILAVVGVLLGYRRHRSAVPLVLAVVGAALVLWVMLGRFDQLTELAGFATLAAATVLDWRLKRAARPQES